MSDLLSQLKPNERRGSKPRCHMLMHGNRAEVAARLTAMIAPWGVVRPDHCWLPQGFDDTREARLGETRGFLRDELKHELSCWWLAVRRGANTPNWDIASTCEIEGEAGLMLVEAKAHTSELSIMGKPTPLTENGWKNTERISAAIQEAGAALNGALRGWALSHYSHYQLSNRFAWAWKVASLGVPVILVYLGFLNAAEMIDYGIPFHSAAEWERLVRVYSAGVVPDEAWDELPLSTGGAPLRAIIRSEQIDLSGDSSHPE